MGGIAGRLDSARAPRRWAADINIAAYINKKGITSRGIFGRRLWDTWEQTLLLVPSLG